MRVLHLYSGNLYGGIESMLATMARRRGVCPDMTPAFALCFEGRLATELRSAGSVVHTLGEVRLTRPASIRSARARLLALVHDERFDVVITHGAWVHALFGGAILAAGVPLVFWVHDALRGRHWTERLARRAVPRLAVCNSRFTQTTLPKVFPGVPSAVVHVPVDLAASVAARRPDTRTALRASLQTVPDDVVIVQASRSEPWKGHRLLIDALGRLSHVPGWTVWIAGGAQRAREAEYLTTLRRRAAAAGIAGRVRWLGERTDVPAILAAADIHCQPNELPEPFGVAFVEALAAGVPVVTCALGGAVEIVNGSCGVLVPPDDSAALASALERLIADRSMREQLGAGGPPRATALSDPAAQLNRLHDLLARMIGTPQAAIA